ncbi:SPOR domain-containing protein [Chlorobium sp. N1]|uniref:SPOR domain-containing protein n=1 Tax=Chlorobium sp. N1 TaxID=2491138 RepID=UPI001038B67D|nr:SPOR domain-containing protein [Chlorobium sp. N1]TCD48655.1 SPOR domain-containing protein [Chlorobium sp. N1]
MPRGKAGSMLRSFALCMAASAALTMLSPAARAAGETSYATLIRQYVEQDKTYLLQKIRQKAVVPSEKAVIEALLCEDGPKAVALFRKQLVMYPDPAIDPISHRRIADYNRTLTAEVPVPRLSKPVATPVPAAPPQPKAAPAAPVAAAVPPAPAAPTPAPEPQKPARYSTTAYAPGDTHTLQFGSFSSRANAEALADRLSAESQVTVVFERQMYKVRLASGFRSADAAKSAGRRLSIPSITLPIR